RLAAVRRAPRFQPSLSPSESAPAAVLPPVAAAPSSAPFPAADAPTTDQILNDLVTKCTEIGLPTTFMVGVDPAAGLLRGELISSSSAARGWTTPSGSPWAASPSSSPTDTTRSRAPAARDASSPH